MTRIMTLAKLREQKKNLERRAIFNGVENRETICSPILSYDDICFFIKAAEAHNKMRRYSRMAAKEIKDAWNPWPKRTGAYGDVDDTRNA